jgi:diguanylate cyclase (GGDEF)-like protein
LKPPVAKISVVPTIHGQAQPATADRAASTAPEHAPRSFRLLRYFAVASLIAIVLAAAGLGFFFRQTALKQLFKMGEDGNVSLARAFANTLRPHYGPLIVAAQKPDAQDLDANPRIARMHQAVLDAVSQSHVVKVRIYDPEGRTIYSSEPAQIGEINGADTGFAAARAGQVTTTLHQPASFRAFGRTLTEASLLASHVPVRRTAGGEIEAVFELYSDMTPFYEDIRRTQRNLRMAVAAVLVLLYCSLFFVVRRADRLIADQELLRRHDEDTIRHLAHHDALTGLPNRKLFGDRLTCAIARVKRSGRMAAVMFIDLDRFKEINDTLGHAVGDKVLQAAGDRLRGALRDADTVARMGGDEFTVILEDIADAAHVQTVAEKIKSAFFAPVILDGGMTIAVTPSIGITLYPLHAENVEDLLGTADAAMYDAKAAGRNTYRFYKPDAGLPPPTLASGASAIV